MTMKYTVHVAITTDEGQTDIREIASVEREDLTPTTLDLTLAEGKAILKDLQEVVVQQQMTAYLETQRSCAHCGHWQRSTGYHTTQVWTVFGTIPVHSLRLYQCMCQSDPSDAAKMFSPLAVRLPEPITPELLFLEARSPKRPSPVSASPSCRPMTRNPNGGCSRCCNRKAISSISRSPFSPMAGTPSASSSSTSTPTPSTCSIGSMSRCGSPCSSRRPTGVVKLMAMLTLSAPRRMKNRGYFRRNSPEVIIGHRGGRATPHTCLMRPWPCR